MEEVADFPAVGHGLIYREAGREVCIKPNGAFVEFRQELRPQFGSQCKAESEGSDGGEDDCLWMGESRTKDWLVDAHRSAHQRVLLVRKIAAQQKPAEQGNESQREQQ